MLTFLAFLKVHLKTETRAPVWHIIRMFDSDSGGKNWELKKKKHLSSCMKISQPAPGSWCAKNVSKII